jgi:hypothetical protein
LIHPPLPEVAQRFSRASAGSGSPCNRTQYLERKLAQYNASQSVLKRWLFEIMSVATSAICIGNKTLPRECVVHVLTRSGATIAILVVLDNHPLSKWPFGLTIINVLTKVASAALILPISEAIGQLKWSWFYGKQSRDVIDFEIFDKASRGAWGSFLLLCHTKGRSLAALGALLTVLLLAVDSFFQQLTDLPTQKTLQGKGHVPRAIWYEPQFPREYINGLEASQINARMQPLADNFFLDNGTQPVDFGNGIRPDIPLSCPTSICTWPPYETLGICSQCTEAPQILAYNCTRTRIDWTSNLNSTSSTYPNATVCGYFLNATSDNPVLVSGYTVGPESQLQGETLIMRTMPLVTNPLRRALWGGSINFKDIRNPIVDVLISSAADKSQVRAHVAPTIHECVLASCVKTIQSSYAYGAYREDILTTRMNHTIGRWPWATYRPAGMNGTITDYLEDMIISTPSTTTNHSGFRWGMNNDTVLGMVMIFDRMFPAFTTVANNSTQGILRWRTGSQTEIRTVHLETNPWLPPNNITLLFERLAIAMTNAIRSDPSSSTTIEGDASIAETYVVVRWAWLAFPLAMLGLSIVFLIATMVKTSQSAQGNLGIWKTSAIPTLLFSLPEDVRHDLPSTSTWHRTQKDGSKPVRIRLEPDQGWRVSGRIAFPPSLHRHNASNPPGWI